MSVDQFFDSPVLVDPSSVASTPAAGTLGRMLEGEPVDDEWLHQDHLMEEEEEEEEEEGEEEEEEAKEEEAEEKQRRSESTTLKDEAAAEVAVEEEVEKAVDDEKGLLYEARLQEECATEGHAMAGVQEHEEKDIRESEPQPNVILHNWWLKLCEGGVIVVGSTSVSVGIDAYSIGKLFLGCLLTAA